MFKQITVAIFTVMIALFASPANAASVILQDDTLQINTAKGIGFAPNADIVIGVRASVYEYSNSDNAYGYVVIALFRTGAKSSSKPLDVFVAYLGKEDESGGPLRIDLRFKAPLAAGQYELRYSSAGTYRSSRISAEDPSSPVGAGSAYRPTSIEATNLWRAMPGYEHDVTSFRVAPQVSAQRPVSTPNVYIRVGGLVLAKAPPITGGVKDAPLSFSWFVGPEYRPANGQGRLLYRYRLYPDDDEIWSAWSPTSSVDYAFLPKGYHELQVQARDVRSGRNVDSTEAHLNFSLKNALTAPIAKGPKGPPASMVAQVDFPTLYPRSRALLIGMWQFDDAVSFPHFEEAKIRADISAMDRGLKANGFLDIQYLVRAHVEKAEIEIAVANFIANATAGDRLVIYFSDHGFADPSHPADGYLAAGNCVQSTLANCVPLTYLRDQAARSLTNANKPRQILFVLDSCFSGLGVMTKASISAMPNLSRLAAEEGAYMITAGMSDQKAQIDPRYGGSTFTHFLSNGLTGDADFFKGGVITLSELLVYVQIEVARATSSSQIPMMGRIYGGGEMLFKPARQP